MPRSDTPLLDALLEMVDEMPRKGVYIDLGDGDLIAPSNLRRSILAFYEQKGSITVSHFPHNDNIPTA